MASRNLFCSSCSKLAVTGMVILHCSHVESHDQTVGAEVIAFPTQDHIEQLENTDAPRFRNALAAITTPAVPFANSLMDNSQRRAFRGGGTDLSGTPMTLIAAASSSF